MKGETKGTQITIRLEKQMNDELRELALSAERDLADYIRISLKKHIEEEKRKIERKSTN